MTETLDRLKAALAGRYAIQRELGSGGMATVYLAEDIRHERHVAIKVLKPELAHALGPERFLREITTTANLHHPHILALYDSGEADGFLFYVMPFVEGESLRDRLDREKQLPIDDAVQIAREVADALSYAHSHDVLHRDIKPENILLESGHAVVADFGIARAISAASGDRLTQTGLAIGTPSYMSPEQAAGSGDLDGRSDLYALGCVFFEMLAGQAPFTGPTVESVIQQHLTVEAPSITNVRPAVPAEVAAAVARALAKTPADRFSPVGQFAEALARRESAAVVATATPTTVKLSGSRARAVMIALTIYVGASWAVLEVTDQIVARYLLPEWVSPVALILLLLGLPIVLGTAFVREEARQLPPHAEQAGKPIVRHLTWPRAILGGALVFAALAAMSALIVVRGSARVTEAHGVAGEAFAERAWIVLAEFDTPESEKEIALAAQTALSVDLQQSQYVNVRGRNQIVPVLRRMGLPDTTRLDETVALEIAQREGMAAVLVPAVARLGDDYVFSARVIQPGTGRELIAVRAAARAERLLEGVEALSRELRSRLGEASAAIRESRPLPEVTTASLEALRKYALAKAALEVDLDRTRAAELAVEATRLDSSFAMAYRLAAVASGDTPQALEYSQRAYERRDRLTDRERMHVEAIYYSQRYDIRRAAEVYDLLLAQYPDDDRALNNLGALNYSYLGRYEGAYQAYLKGLTLNPYSALKYNNVILAAYLVDRLDLADSLTAVARAQGFEGQAARWLRRHAIASGDFDRADALCDSLLGEPASAGRVAEEQSTCGSVSAARGRIGEAIERMEAAGRYYAEQQMYLDYSTVAVGVALAEQIRRRPTAARARLEAALGRFPADSIRQFARVVYRTTLSVGAGLLGHTDLQERFAERYPEPSGAVPWTIEYAEALVGAARSLAQGNPEAALAALHEIDALGYELSGWLSHAHLMRARAYRELGDPNAEMHHLQEMIHARRTTEGGSWKFLSLAQLPFALLRLAELAEARGDTEAAIEHYRQFLDLWSDPDPELRDQVTSARRALEELARGR